MMRVVRELEAFEPEQAAWVSLGVFDGVHRGHQAVLSRLGARARRDGLPALVLTFEAHPLSVIEGRPGPPLLMTLEEKLEAIGTLGIDIAIVARFDARFAATPAEPFAREVLFGQLRARGVVVGETTRFGQGARGDPTLLAELGRQAGVTVEVVPPQQVEGLPVSSTAIRAAVARGEVELAAQMLGRPYSLANRVERGQGRGRQLGFATANLALPGKKVIPADGVYACWACLGGQRLAAAVSAGRAPTFPGERARIEVHIPGLDQELYDEQIRVEFIRFLRAERKFASPNQLREQIVRDVEAALEALGAVAVPKRLFDDNR